MPEKETLQTLRQRLKRLEKELAEKTDIIEKLVEGGELFDQLTEFAPVATFEVSGPQGRFLKVNQAVCDILGYSEKEMLAMNASDILSGESQKLFRERYRNANERKTQSPVAEYELMAKDGEKKCALINIQYVYQNGRLSKGRGIGLEITERKKTEEELKEAHEKHLLILRHATAGIAVFQNRKGQFYNREMRRILGYSTEELSQMEGGTFLAFVHPDNREKVLNDFRSYQSGETLPMPYMMRVVTKNGETRWVEASTVGIQWEDNPAMLIFLTDRTDHKRMEDALRENERRFRILVEEMNDGLGVQDKDGKFTYVNDQFCLIMGRPREELLNHRAIDFLDKAGQEIYKAQMAQRKKGRAGFYEQTLAGEDGQQITVRISSRPLLDEKGEYQGSFGIVSNITKTKQIENELRELNTALETRVKQRTAELEQINRQLYKEIAERELSQRILQRGAEIFNSLFESLECVYIHDLDGKMLRVNKATEDLLGYSEGELVSMNINSLFKPNQSKKAAQAIKEIVQTGHQETPTEFKMKRKTGELVYVETKGSLIAFNHDRQAVLGVARDITKRKNAEKSLIERTKSLKSQTKQLEELNTALKVLLEFREKEKSEQEKSMLDMLRKLILPYLLRLETGNLDENQLTLLQIIKSNLANIASPLASRLISPEINLSPMEIEIAEMVRQGKTSKEIARLLGLSFDTVSFHRKRMRIKLGLKDRKVNLRSYLQSFMKKEDFKVPLP